MEGQGNVWGVTDSIKSDVYDIKVTLARLDERSASRDATVQVMASKLDAVEARVNKLDIKLAAAVAGMMVVAWGVELLASVMG